MSHYEPLEGPEERPRPARRPWWRVYGPTILDVLKTVILLVAVVFVSRESNRAAGQIDALQAELKVFLSELRSVYRQLDQLQAFTSQLQSLNSSVTVAYADIRAIQQSVETVAGRAEMLLANGTALVSSVQANLSAVLGTVTKLNTSRALTLRAMWSATVLDVTQTTCLSRVSVPGCCAVKAMQWTGLRTLCLVDPLGNCLTTDGSQPAWAACSFNSNCIPLSWNSDNGTLYDAEFGFLQMNATFGQQRPPAYFLYPHPWSWEPASVPAHQGVDGYADWYEVAHILSSSTS